IQIAGLSLNLALVPIALGAILFGPAGGALLGLICGFIVTMYGVTGAEGFTFYLFNASPLATVLICLVKTTAAGAVAGAAYWLIAKKNKVVAVFVTSALVPIVNTGIFAIGCFIIYDDILSYLSMYGLDYSAENAFYVIFVVVITWNFFIELLTSLLLAPAVATVTRIVEKQIVKNNKKHKVAVNTENSDNITDIKNDNLS
ncbi:MAG: hypothetical protein LUD27_05920, partial [Clostridia bacterium]|nr:hypothetical protein [Clostridia bacterium]